MTRLSSLPMPRTFQSAFSHHTPFAVWRAACSRSTRDLSESIGVRCTSPLASSGTPTRSRRNSRATRCCATGRLPAATAVWMRMASGSAALTCCVRSARHPTFTPPPISLRRPGSCCSPRTQPSAKCISVTRERQRIDGCSFQPEPGCSIAPGEFSFFILFSHFASSSGDCSSWAELAQKLTCCRFLCGATCCSLMTR
jgi:hypothetical protein